MPGPPPSRRSRRSRGRALAGVFVAATVSVLAGPGAAGSDPADHTVTRASSAIVVDGVLDEAAWAEAEVIPIPYEWFPADNTPAVVDTEVRLTYDDRNVYLSFKCFDPEPAKIRAHLMDRDDVEAFVRDDHVLFMLDTFNDERRGFQFRVNPQGVQMDAIFSETEGVEDFSWDVIWDSAGRIDEDGYTVEVAIPVQQLRFPKGVDVQTWGIDLGRSYPRSIRHRLSAHRRERDVACSLCQVVKVEGFEGLKPGRNLELDPTVTGIRTDTRESLPDGPVVPGEEEIDVGLTARWGPTPNLAVSAAVNPDFSQVEADVAQISVNERFALFFPERRPFFLEGIDLFSTPINAVFTRTVVDPEWGLKTTGKSGADAFGVFLTRDAANTLVLPANAGSTIVSSEDEGSPLASDVDAAVLRYRRDVGKGNTVGVLFTGREGDGYRNRVGGADGFFRFGPSTTTRFQWLRSSTRYPQGLSDAYGQPRGSFADDAWYGEYQYGGRNWVTQVQVENFGRDFRADSGFVPRVDTRELRYFTRRRWYSEGKPWYATMDAQVFAFHTEDQDGRVTDRYHQVSWVYRGPLQSIVIAEVSRLDQRYLDRFFDDLDRVFFYVEGQPTGDLRLEFLVFRGDAVDFVNSRRGTIDEWEAAADLRLGKRFSVELDHLSRKLDVPDGTLFDADLSQARMFWHLSVRSFFRAILQREAISRDPATWPVPVPRESESLFGQLLFSYKLNPQTVAFVGYTESREGTEAFSPVTVDRTFFVKLGYAWLL